MSKGSNGWFRRKKGSLVYCWLVQAATGEKKERSKVVGPDTMSNEQGWEEVGRLKQAGKIRMDLDKPANEKTFRDLAAYYLAHKEWRKESTKRLHTQVINNILLPKWGERIAVSIRPKQIKDWLKSLTVEDGTKISYKTRMGTVYSFAVSEEQLPSVYFQPDGTIESSNPVSRVRGVASGLKYEAIALRPEQALRVLQELRQPEYTMVLIIAVTGMRASELFGLRWSDILWDRGEARIRNTHVHGRLQDGAKTLLSQSTVMLHQVLVQLLKEWRVQSIYAKDLDFVFASTKLRGREPRLSSMVVEDYLRPAAVRAGVIEVREDGKTYLVETGEFVKRFGFHTFRHSLTSWMMDAGENPQIVRSMLRWTNLNMLAHYAHGFRKSKLEAQGRVLGDLLGTQRELNGSQVQ